LHINTVNSHVWAEGAAFALVASLLGIPRISLRVVSNYADPNPEWDVPLAKRELAVGVQRVISAYMGNTL